MQHAETVPGGHAALHEPERVPALAALQPIGFWGTAAWGLAAVLFLNLAYNWPAAGFLVFAYLFALMQLARANTWRLAFYGGLGVGLLTGVLRLDFFWRIFSGGAVALWIVFAFWIGLFAALARLCVLKPPFRKTGNWLWLVPFVWCGLEYFRSELYYLRFAWLSPGLAFGTSTKLVPLGIVGAYGIGFLSAAVACFAFLRWRRSKWQALAVLALGAGLLRLWGMFPGTSPNVEPPRNVRVAGVQMEFPTEPEVLLRLNELLRKHPDAQLLVLSEYTFGEPVPEKVLKWCRDHARYLIVGGKDPLGNGQFYNTAFVISPEGKVVFRQVKSVPIQFFKDGLPAPEQNVWNSPWGKIGICICYDLSYTRVTDRLVKLGAEALIVPTMDVFDWGVRQHQLHARVAPVRAAEYGLPIFRVASSGVSQMVDNDGQVMSSAPCPGEGATLAGTLSLRGPGHLPFDRLLVPLCLLALLALISASLWDAFVRSRSNRPAPRTST